MKKAICILFCLTVLVTSTFADKSRFYENGKVIDTMYVDSKEGLRVRDYPSLKSNRICGLTHRLPVKVVAIGKEETIDGIKAPWVEILIPRYEWKSAEPEYGWVFGGYLSKEQAKFVAPKNENELYSYLTFVGKFTEYENDETHYYDFTFRDDGNFWHGVPESGIGEGGEWGVTSKNTVQFHTSYVMEFEEDYNWTLTFVFEDDGSFHYDTGKTINYCYPSFQNSDNPSLYSTTRKGNYLTYYDEYSESWSPYDPIEKYVKMRIKWGISAKGTKFENLYREYWDPIMEEHQKKVDKME